MSALPADVNANTTGRPLESHCALISSESMLTSVLVLEFDLAMNENVLVTAPGETSALAVAVPIAASAPMAIPTAARRRGLMIRFTALSFPWLGHAWWSARLPSAAAEIVSSRLLQFGAGRPKYPRPR